MMGIVTLTTQLEEMVFMVALLIVAAIVALAVVVVSFGGAVIGVMAAISGESFGKCPRCHRYSWSVGGTLHHGGCPPPVHLLHLHVPHHVVRHH